MPPRATLLLYTDGLVERRREALDAASPEPPTSSGTTRRPGSTTWPNDHGAAGARGGYRTTLPCCSTASPRLGNGVSRRRDQLAPSRAALRGWLTQAGVEPDQTLDVLIATGEALANAIDTATGMGKGPRGNSRHGDPARHRIGGPPARHRRRHRDLENGGRGRSAPWSGHRTDEGPDA